MSADGIREKALAVCLRNDGYETDLDVGTVYVVLSDAVAGERGRLRVVDESGEDYLYPTDCFLTVELSQPAKDALAVA